MSFQLLVVDEEKTGLGDALCSHIERYEAVSSVAIAGGQDVQGPLADAVRRSPGLGRVRIIHILPNPKPTLEIRMIQTLQGWRQECQWTGAYCACVPVARVQELSGWHVFSQYQPSHSIISFPIRLTKVRHWLSVEPHLNSIAPNGWQRAYSFSLLRDLLSKAIKTKPWLPLAQPACTELCKTVLALTEGRGHHTPAVCTLASRLRSFASGQNQTKTQDLLDALDGLLKEYTSR